MQKIIGEIKIEPSRLKRLTTSVKNIADFQKELEAVLAKETTQVLEVILTAAINLEASDVHIEPEEEKAKVRLRIDGILHDITATNPKIYESLVSRIKLLSGVKLNITEQAQDGRFSVVLGEKDIEIRSSTLPSEYGEAIVLRVLDPKNLIEIENLGIREDIIEVFKKEISQPNGMIIVTGPTGSGKTTTLYSILNRIKKEELKIITIEDPIEYHLAGISQSQVNPRKGYDFATGLQSIVRQDPDVILVGEIRDLETAKIGIQAALTGHLVLTTLHTNDAAGTIARLQALGEKPVNIAPAIRLALAQRLLREVCKKCSKLTTVSPKDLALLKEGLKGLPKKTKTSLKLPVLSKALKIPKAKGCKYCNFTGYRGRTGVFEFFLVDDEMENFVVKSHSIAELRKKAREKGMISMREDGLIKVVRKITTIEEVERVIGD